MKDIKVYRPRHAAAPPEREYFKGSRLTPEQADAVKTLGGKTTTDHDEWFWRYWG